MWLSYLLIMAARVVVGATPRWIGCTPSPRQRIYFANHTSHIDAVALWSALPPELRARTHPVAAADYWGRSRLRRYVVLRGLNAVLIDRNKRNDPDANPLQPLFDTLARGDSLIMFPEGTRQFQSLPGPFKAGLFHLAEQYPQVELIPVYLDNLHHSMPKGSYLPMPVRCNVRFGAPLYLDANEDKLKFLERARNAVIDIARQAGKVQ